MELLFDLAFCIFLLAPFVLLVWCVAVMIMLEEDGR